MAFGDPTVWAELRRAQREREPVTLTPEQVDDLLHRFPGAARERAK